MYKFMNDPYRCHPFYDADKGGGGGAAGSESGDGGQEDEDAGGDGQGADEGAGENGEDDADEKKYTQADVDAAVKKRLEREKRKWQREQQQKSEKPDSKAKTGEDGGGKSDDAELAKERRRNEKLTMRLACYDAGVPKESVKDVTALARSYMEEDEDLDFEDAIEEVLKKYPQFKGSSDGGEGEKGAWGQRQRGKGAKKDKSLEDEIEEALFGK